MSQLRTLRSLVDALSEHGDHPAVAANPPITANDALHKSAFRSFAYLRHLDRLYQKVQPLHTVEPWIGILLQRLLWIYAQLRKVTQENAERDLRFQAS